MDHRARPPRPIPAPAPAARRLSAGVAGLCLLALLALVVGAGAARAAEPGSGPCQADAVHHQLDFWLGEWRAVDAQGKELGRSRVEKLHGGCLIQEAWTAAGGAGSGESLNFVDPADGAWHQVWVDSSGNVARFHGTVEGGALHLEGEDASADGTSYLSRSQLVPEAGGSVHYKIERSDDGGATWTNYFEATYVPAGRPALLPEPAPAPASAPEATPASPAPTAAPSAAPAPAPKAAPPSGGAPGQVTAVSVPVPDADLPPEQREKTHLRSPMQLDVPVGAIESIPEEYSWSTDETARYVVDGATIPRVTVSRDENRKGVALDVTVAVYSSQYLQHGDLDVALLAPGGETVATARLESFSLGRSLSGQKGKAGIEKKVRLELDRKTFDRIFGSGPRPVLRLTLAVRD